MIHLFKKVYLTSDKVISHDFDRVVISETNGVDMSVELARVTQGKLLGFGTSIKDMTFGPFADMLTSLSKHAGETNKRIVIYADDASFLDIICTYYKYILLNPDMDAVRSLVKSTIFRMNTIYHGRFSSSTGENGSGDIVNANEFDEAWKNAKPNMADRVSFMRDHTSSLSVEFLLASYLHDGSHKEELKSVLKPLISKDLEKFMIEMKEIFFYHVMNSDFSSAIGLDQQYDISNIDELSEDTSKFALLFTTDRIWNSKFASIPSSGHNINFSELTDEDISSLKEFAKIAYSHWSDVQVTDNAEIVKFKYIPALVGDFTDEELEDVIKIEASHATVTGSFFSNDHESVNHYFIQTLLNNKENSDFTSNYVV